MTTGSAHSERRSDEYSNPNQKRSILPCVRRKDGVTQTSREIGYTVCAVLAVLEVQMWLSWYAHFEQKGELKMYYQQGDVLLQKVSEIPESAKKKANINGRIVLAEGEATGHAHAITDVAECELYTLADALFVKCGTAVTVTHEEHKPITLPAGVWRVSIVREYDHFQEEARRIID